MFKHIGFLFAALLLAGSASAADAPAATKSDWKEGTNYFLIEPAQPVASGNKIEVLEIFSYACPHCAHFQPYAEQIKQSLPSYAAFDYMPAIFNASWEPYARAYYTAQSMGVLAKTHQALFDALHRDHIPMRTIEDLAGFYAQQGVDRAKFLATAASFEVESKLSRAFDIVKNDGIDGTPSIVVNGKYRITGASAGGFPQMVELTDWLVKKEHDATAKADKPAKAK